MSLPNSTDIGSSCPRPPLGPLSPIKAVANTPIYSQRFTASFHNANNENMFRWPSPSPNPWQTGDIDVEMSDLEPRMPGHVSSTSSHDLTFQTVFNPENAPRKRQRLTKPRANASENILPTPTRTTATRRSPCNQFTNW